MRQLITVPEVSRIASLTDPVARNLQITQSYHEISLAMTKRLGPCANWCTFATWASRQAGQTIRGEDLAQASGKPVPWTGPTSPTGCISSWIFSDATRSPSAC